LGGKESLSTAMKGKGIAFRGVPLLKGKRRRSLSCQQRLFSRWKLSWGGENRTSREKKRISWQAGKKKKPIEERKRKNCWGRSKGKRKQGLIGLLRGATESKNSEKHSHILHPL